jgi:hypothetical protein
LIFSNISVFIVRAVSDLTTRPFSYVNIIFLIFKSLENLIQSGFGRRVLDRILGEQEGRRTPQDK